MMLGTYGSNFFLSWLRISLILKFKSFRTNNGLDFNMLSFYGSRGFFFLHQLTCVTTDQQNSTVERKHQHSIIVTKALRIQSNLPLSFGGLVFNYLIN